MQDVDLVIKGVGCLMQTQCRYMFTKGPKYGIPKLVPEFLVKFFKGEAQLPKQVLKRLIFLQRESKEKDKEGSNFYEKEKSD